MDESQPVPTKDLYHSAQSLYDGSRWSDYRKPADLLCLRLFLPIDELHPLDPRRRIEYDQKLMAQLAKAALTNKKISNAARYEIGLRYMLEIFSQPTSGPRRFPEQAWCLSCFNPIPAPPYLIEHQRTCARCGRFAAAGTEHACNAAEQWLHGDNG